MKKLLLLSLLLSCFTLFGQNNDYLRDAILKKMATVQQDSVENVLAQNIDWYDQMENTLASLEEEDVVNFDRYTNDCITAIPICLNLTNTYPLSTSIMAEFGPEYGCLSSQPNPVWTYFRVVSHTDGATTGMMDLLLTATSDIDFIVWGPFDDRTCDTLDLVSENILDCSYSPTNIETPSINTENGKFYMMLITNFSNTTQDFTLVQSSGTAVSDCITLFNLDGQVYLDLDDNCANEMESSFQDAFVHFSPGDFYATIDEMGNYLTGLSPGTYTYDIISPVTNLSSCSDTIIIYDDTISHYYDLPLYTDIVNDPMVSITSPTLTTDSVFYICINNLGVNSASGSVIINFDNALFVEEASVPYTVVDDHTIEIEYTDLNFFQPQCYTVTTNSLSLIEFLNYEAVTTAEIFSDDPDENLDNNISVDYTTILLPYDPNNILASPRGHYDTNIMSLDQKTITYTINFQNTGSAPATDVFILDNIPSDLDFSSMQLLASSHTCKVDLLNNGLYKFSFDNINLPDSLNNEAESHGWVTFSLGINAPLVEGQWIYNSASIYFDENPPIYTNTVSNTVETIVISTNDLEERKIKYYPNPTSGRLNILSPDPVDIVIYDLLGHVALEINNCTTKTLDLGQLSKAVYFISFITKGKVITDKIIIE